MARVTGTSIAVSSTSAPGLDVLQQVKYTQHGARADRVTVAVKYGDYGCIIGLTGALDAEAVPALRSALDPSEPRCHRMILDLSGVTFLDSAGLQVILDLYRRLHDRDCTLTLIESEQGNVARVLRSAGLESLIDRVE